MRCRACDCELTDIESTRKDPQTGEFIDLCGGCMSAIRLAQFEDDIEISSVVPVVSDEDSW